MFNTFSKLLRGIALAGVGLLVQAQSVNRVNGLVTDQSGAVIVGAAVTAREVNTGGVTLAKTNERGYYLMQLPIGTYNIAIYSTGFQSAVREKVPVDVGADVRLDFKLGLATAQETIDVVAEGAPLLRADSSTVQTTVDNKLVNDLPIAVSGRERNAAGFLALTPRLSGWPAERWRRRGQHHVCRRRRGQPLLFFAGAHH